MRFRSPILTLPKRLPIRTCDSTTVPAPMQTRPVIRQNGPISASGEISASAETIDDGWMLIEAAPRSAAKRASGIIVCKRCSSITRPRCGKHDARTMPASLSPEYKRSEQAYRAAQDERERLECLKEMLRTIPKHKGTEHLQADIKSRIKQLTDELSGPRKGAARTGPVHVVRREGAAQIALIGPPNSGKSALHVRLTGSRASVGPFPHATIEPLPGMLAYEDIHFQLV